MSPTDQPLREPDERVEAIVLECLDADDVAAAVDRACASHPEHADLIRRLVDRLQNDALFAPTEAPLADATNTSSPTGSAEGALAIPARLGNYRLVRRLGEGGMGVVFLARDEHLGRDVAVKLVRPELLWFERSRERFAREVEAVARLHFPGIVGIHAVGEQDGLPYYAMDFVAGESLAQRLHRARGLCGRRGDGEASERSTTRPSGLPGRLLLFGETRGLRGSTRAAAKAPDPASAPLEPSTPTESDRRALPWIQACLYLVRDVALAVQHAHARGVLHRDIKPSNVLVDVRGQAVLVDFGLARIEGAPELTRSNSQIGSLPYTPPEALDGTADQLTVAGDVYGLGVTLYEALTLTSPFLGANNEETRRRVVSGDCARPRSLEPAVGHDLESVVLKAIDPRPDRRYQSMNEFVADLSALLENRPVQARRASAWDRTRRWLQRHPATGVAVASAFVLFVLVPIAVALWQNRVARDMRTLAKHSERQGYLASVSGAAASLAAGSTDSAQRSLTLAAPALRGWEWRHLDFEADRADIVWRTDGVLESVVALPDHGALLTGARHGELLLFAPGAIEPVAHGTLGRPLLAMTRRPGSDEVYATAREEPGLWRLRIHGEDLGFSEIERIGDTGGAARGLAFSPDGAVLALGLDGSVVELRDPDTGALRARLGRPTPWPSRVFGLAFSPSGEELAVTWGGAIHVYAQPFVEGSEPRVVEHGDDGASGMSKFLQALAWVDDEHLLVADVGGEAIEADLRTGERTRLAGRIQGPFAFDGEIGLLFGSGSGRLLPLRRRGGESSEWAPAGPARRGHTGVIQDAEFFAPDALAGDPVAPMLATVGEDGALRMWEVDAPPDHATPSGGAIDEIAVTGSSAVVATADGTIHRFDVRSGEQTAQRSHGARIDHMVSGSGYTVAIGSASGRAVLYAGDQLTPYTLDLPFAAHASTVDPRTGEIVVLGERGALAVFSQDDIERPLVGPRADERAPTRPGGAAGEHPAPERPHATEHAPGLVAAPPHGGASAGVPDGEVPDDTARLRPGRVADLVESSLPADVRFVDLVALPQPAYGLVAITAQGDLWQLSSSGGVAPRLVGHHEEAQDICAAGSVGVVLTCGYDGRVVRWRLQDLGADPESDEGYAGDGETLLEWPRQLLTQIVLDETGTRLFTATMRGKLRVWDAETGDLLIELDGHRRSIFALAFAEGCDALVSGSWDGVVRFHRTRRTRGRDRRPR